MNRLSCVCSASSQPPLGLGIPGPLCVFPVALQSLSSCRETADLWSLDYLARLDSAEEHLKTRPVRLPINAHRLHAFLFYKTHITVNVFALQWFCKTLYHVSEATARRCL